MANIFKRGWWKVAGVPYVTTTYGHDRCDALHKHEGCQEDENAKVDWVEYRKRNELTGEDEIVHRSVTIAIKQSIDLGATQGKLE
jgi:hypothetical protein